MSGYILGEAVGNNKISGNIHMNIYFDCRKALYANSEYKYKSKGVDIYENERIYRMEKRRNDS
jgi:hypothetical protein